MYLELWQIVLLVIAVGSFTVAIMCILFAARQTPEFENEIFLESSKAKDKHIEKLEDEILRLKKLMKIKGVLQ